MYTTSDLVRCLEEALSRELTWKMLHEVQRRKTKASVASWGSLVYLQCYQKVQEVASVKCEILKLQKCPLRELGNTWIFSSTRILSSLHHMQYIAYIHIFSKCFIAYLFKFTFYGFIPSKVWKQYLFYISNMFIYYQWYDSWPLNANVLLLNASMMKLYPLCPMFLNMKIRWQWKVKSSLRKLLNNLFLWCFNL